MSNTSAMYSRIASTRLVEHPVHILTELEAPQSYPMQISRLQMDLRLRQETTHVQVHTTNQWQFGNLQLFPLALLQSGKAHGVPSMFGHIGGVRPQRFIDFWIRIGLCGDFSVAKISGTALSRREDLILEHHVSYDLRTPCSQDDSDVYFTQRLPNTSCCI